MLSKNDKKTTILVLVVMLGLPWGLVAGCWRVEGDTDLDAGPDNSSDADSDTDADSDADTDVDTDADSDTDVDSDTDTDSLPPGCDGVLLFPDPDIEDSIRDEINKPMRNLYQEDVSGIIRLGSTYSSVSNLTGLQCLTNLEELYLYDNKITDISPLSGLTELTVLYLDFNKITDISPLSEMTDLTELYLNSNMITDLSPLVANSGLGIEFYDYDYLNIEDNSIDCNEQADNIAELESRNWAFFHYDCN